MAEGFPFGSRSILKNVPATSGVYALHSQWSCIYVGDAEDLCANLLLHVQDDNPCLDRLELLYFDFEIVPPEAREARWTELVLKLHPTCLGREDYPECKGCSLARRLARGG